ncbi:hypothetical protein NEMBOFW57_005062 [Staphylotrichum longicolle]|uniref:Protection of telomeres protein 1 n=1 Tax=Staphylotrichum longicolle TaxID=669026 RepID=A0AAD4HZA8_9PEZI|nr:hypothetical protein NEMBOFW57_005062 [Staphylotrichum longicolle]
MPAGGSRKGAVDAAPPEPSLPKNYTELRAILEGSVTQGQFINVIGVVKDCRLPIPTHGSDYKCTLTLYDLSIEDENHGIRFVIFRPEADMPQVTLGDVVVLTTVRVHKYLADPLSLITNRNTSIRVYTASKIPQPPQSAQVALSLNVKQKFSLLKDIQDGKFYDLIVQVAREPYSNFGMSTLYVSDYTANPKFHLQRWEGLSESTSGDGDPYGYTSGSAAVPKTDWVGPYGKMSLQVTCFGEHSRYVCDEVTAGRWVALRNVQIKYGRDGSFLEGFIREERNVTNARINVTVLDTGDRETIDPKLKEAIRRCRDYDKKKKQQMKEVKAAQTAGAKRKASAPSEQEERRLNSKGRRKAKRADKQQKPREESSNGQLRLELNGQVTCEAHDAPYSTIESILEPPLHETTTRPRLAMPTLHTKPKPGSSISSRPLSPFPETDRLRRTLRNEDETMSSSDDRNGRARLQLEDLPPATQTPPHTVRRSLATSSAASGLDAADLRRDPATLAQLRERMFTLWGDLEEHKARAAGRERRGDQAAVNGDRRDPRREKPPMESDAEDDGEEPEQAVSNKPFACCIKQYGVYEKGGEEEGGRWVRCFGLFGTKICS